MGKLFGTDGIRGRANQYPMVPEVALKLGKAIGYIFSNHGKSRRMVVIGKDTRLSGYMFEAALVAGICSAGADAHLLGPMPTPGISFITKNMRADAGVVISASHNPYYDNGIKVFTEEGLKLSTELERRIEELIEGDEIPASWDRIGRAYRVPDALGRYIVHLKGSFPEGETLEGMKLVVDCANGATYRVAPMVFEELQADVVAINCEPNGLNINEGCGAVHPEGMAKKVVEVGAHLGVAFDGDGDRAIFADEKGRIVDGDDVLAICALQMKEAGLLDVPVVVSTIMAGKGLEVALKEAGIRLERTKVGDRFVYEGMVATGSVLGGEPSGHVIFRHYANTGDGIITALRLLWVMKATGKTLSQLVDERVKRFPRVETSVRVSGKPPIDSTPLGEVVRRVSEEVERDIKGRVVVRYSGTEPKLRIMVEGEEEDRVKYYAELLREEAEKHLGGGC